MAQNSNVSGGHSVYVNPATVTHLHKSRAVLMLQGQGMGPHEVKKPTSSCIRAKPDSYFPTRGQISFQKLPGTLISSKYKWESCAFRGMCVSFGFYGFTLVGCFVCFLRQASLTPG